MSSSANSLIASSSRALRLRLRPDLQFTRQQYQGRDYWVVKDPVSLKYFRFEEEEYALLNLLNGKSSAEHIKQQFESRFAPQKLTFSELFQFVGMLFRQSLLISDATGQGQELEKRGAENKKRLARASMMNILSLRIRGFDPGSTLNFLNSCFGWFFSLPVACFNICLMLAAVALIFSQFELFQAKLPDMQSFFAAKNWIWLGIILAVTKIIHELGHGLSCKRLGGECHEMGIMFLVLMPCLYCNVSDSWMLKSKWRRIAIAAAGMYVELVLASICTFIWWFSQPGMINSLALNVMFVCSISTLLFNANPLLRYDGYYILSDFIEVPNLRQKASNVLRRFFSEVCLGLPSLNDPFMPSRNKMLFALYSVAAVAYRWMITFIIFWFLYRLLEPYGLKIVGQLLAVFTLYGLVGMPLIQAYKFFSVPGRIQAVKPLRFGITIASIFAILCAIMLIPIPHRIQCSFHIQPDSANRVYVEVPGTLDEIFAEDNQMVTAGQPIARLTNNEQSEIIASLHGQLGVTFVRYEHAKIRGNVDPTAANEVDSAVALYNTIKSQYDQRMMDSEKLTIVAPTSGKFMFASYVPKKKDDSGNLPRWSGYSLEPRNRGAYLEHGTLLGEVITDERYLEAVLVIDQSDVEFVQPGQLVDLWSRQHPSRFYHSRIDQISPTQMKAVPPALSSEFGGDIITKSDSSGGHSPAGTMYQISVPLENDHGLILSGSTGVARIHVGNSTVGQRLWRIVCTTFRFEL